MKNRIIIYFAAILFVFTSSLIAQEEKENLFVDSLLNRMTLEEKIGQLVELVTPKSVTKKMLSNGNVSSILGIKDADLANELQQIAVEESRLGIPLLFTNDVIHGYNTTFPIPLAEAASWNPELIEEGIRFKGRQKYLNKIDRNFIDLIFEDRIGYHLIIELKIGPIKFEHIDQIKKYGEIYKSTYSKNTRMMLVGNKINKSMVQILNMEKVEYKEIKISELKLFLKKKEDHIFLRYFDKSDQMKREPRKKGTKVPRHERVGVLTGKHIWNSRGGTYQNRFCKLVIEAGDKGVSMEEAQYAPWNRGVQFPQFQR